MEYLLLGSVAGKGWVRQFYLGGLKHGDHDQSTHGRGGAGGGGKLKRHESYDELPMSDKANGSSIIRAYFITPDNDLVSVHQEIGGGTNDHIGFVAAMDDPEALGVDGKVVARFAKEANKEKFDAKYDDAYEKLWESINASGNIRVREFDFGENQGTSSNTHVISIQNAPLANQSDLIMLQSKINMRKIPYDRNATYDIEARGYEYFRVRGSDLMTASNIYDLKAASSRKHLEGQHDQVASTKSDEANEEVFYSTAQRRWLMASPTKAVKTKTRPTKQQAESSVESSLSRVYDKYRGTVAGYAVKGKGVPKKVYDAMARELRDVLGDELRKVYVDNALDSQAALGARVGIDVKWSSPNTNAQAWAEKYTFELVRGLQDTTIAQVQSNVAALQEDVSKFFDKPTTLADLGGDIAQYIPDWEDKLGRVWSSEERGKMIAATEVTRASVEGEYDAVRYLADEYGIEMVAVWQTSNDEFMCDICAPLHDTEQGEAWDEPPPAHPNCRCAVSMVLKGDGKKHGDHDQSTHGRGGNGKQVDHKQKVIMNEVINKLTHPSSMDTAMNKIMSVSGFTEGSFIIDKNGNWRELNGQMSHHGLSGEAKGKGVRNPMEHYVRVSIGYRSAGIEHDSEFTTPDQKRSVAELSRRLKEADVQFAEQDHQVSGYPYGKSIPAWSLPWSVTEIVELARRESAKHGDHDQSTHGHKGGGDMALREYGGSDPYAAGAAIALNGELRSNNGNLSRMNKESREAVEKIDLEMKINSKKFSKPTVLYRGVSDPIATDRYGRFVDRGYTSTSMSQDVADEFANSTGGSDPTVYEIHVPKGVRYVNPVEYMDEFDQAAMGYQAEALLPRNMVFEVKGRKGNVTVVELVGGDAWAMGKGSFDKDGNYR